MCIRDSARLVRTAIYNLLTNALRATPEDGEITVSLTDTRDFVTIAVTDTGPGLDPAKFCLLYTSRCV